MGYCIDQTDSKFTVKEANKIPAMKAIKAAFKGKGQIGWIREDELKGTDSFSEVMRKCRWDCDLDDDDNVDSIEFQGEKAGEDIDVVFNAIAPYVEAGSYVEFHGEDGDLFRYVFDGSTMKEKNATVSWD